MIRSTLATILWLRWRLLYHQSLRRGGLGAVLAVLFVAGAAAVAAVCFVAALAMALWTARGASPASIAGLWFGVTCAFLFFWTIGLVTELQRAETIELERLMHLPVLLGPLFVVNYLASHFTPSIVLFVPALLGLAVGSAIARGPIMALMVPLSLAMVCMVTAWTYCLRGWLATMISNPRRRRSVIMAITLGFVAVVQVPNVYFNVLSHGTSEAGARAARLMEKLTTVQAFVPPLWVSIGAGTLAEGRSWPALLGTLGCLGLAGLGLGRAYRATVRFYRGEPDRTSAGRVQGTSARREVVRASVRRRRQFVETRIPGLPEPAAALALATLRSMLRAPEVRMPLASSLFAMLLFGSAMLLRARSAPAPANVPLLATGTVLMSSFLVFPFFNNQFGLDRDGFRALILSPMDRRLILLGKNLACAPIAAGFGVVLLGGAAVFLPLRWADFMAALLQLVTLTLFAALAGNLLSIVAPYRIQPGSLRMSKMPISMKIMTVALQLAYPLATAPVLLLPWAELTWRSEGSSGALPINLVLSLLLCLVTAALYAGTLAPLGRLLHRRETLILRAVTAQSE
jgi:ABC-2 type transport system permease protein